MLLSVDVVERLRLSLAADPLLAATCAPDAPPIVLVLVLVAEL